MNVVVIDSSMVSSYRPWYTEFLACMHTRWVDRDKRPTKSQYRWSCFPFFKTLQWCIFFCLTIRWLWSSFRKIGPMIWHFPSTSLSSLRCPAMMLAYLSSCGPKSTKGSSKSSCFNLFLRSGFIISFFRRSDRQVTGFRFRKSTKKSLRWPSSKAHIVLNRLHKYQAI